MRGDAIIKLFMKRKHAFLLVLIIYTTTLILGTTALAYFKFVIEGQDRILESIVDLDEGVLVTSFAISPFTSLVNPEVLEKRLQGVVNITIDYYFITLGYVYGEPIVVVGSHLVEDNCAFVKADIYREAIEKGFTSLPILSPFTGETVFLRICGESEKPYILVSHASAARLRGVPSRYYTIAVVKPSSPESLSRVLKALNVEQTSKALVFRVIALLGKTNNNVTSRLYASLSELYFARLGISREYFTYFTSGVLTVLLIGVPLAGYGIVVYTEPILRVLRRIGVSKLDLFKALCMYMALPMIPALVLVYLTLNFVPEIEVLGLVPAIRPSTLDIALVCTFVYTASVLGIMWGLRSELE